MFCLYWLVNGKAITSIELSLRNPEAYSVIDQAIYWATFDPTRDVSIEFEGEVYTPERFDQIMHDKLTDPLWQPKEGL